MTTRSRASTVPTKITNVAANIQQASREAQMSAAATTRQRQSMNRDFAPRGSHEIELISSQGLMGCRNWLIQHENLLREKLEGEWVDHDERITREDRNDYAVVQGLRIHAEYLCSRLSTKALTSSESAIVSEQLAAIVTYVSSRQNT